MTKKAGMAEIGSFTSRAHAEMAAGMLDAHGVRSDIMGDDAGGALPHVAVGSHGYRLHVADVDVEEAEALLDELADDHRSAGTTDEDRSAAGSMNRTRVFRAVAAIILAAVVIGVLIGLVT